MSDDKELDEIQAIFFEECVEGLGTAEEGLTALANGEASLDVIAGVFRAVHSIKGGAGAFGHNALLTFAHAFENVLDKIRAGDIAATLEIGQQMLSAFDVLSDHVSAAMGRGDIPDDGPVLAGLNALLSDGGAPAPAPVTEVPPPAEEVSADPATEADEFGFTPVTVDLDDFSASLDLGEGEEENDSPWIVTFQPSRAAMANGAEPLLVIRELERMGARVTDADISKLPSLRELEPEQGYICWKMIIDGSVERSELDECFDFVAPDSVIDYHHRESEQPAEQPEAPQTDTPPEAGAETPINPRQRRPRPSLPLFQPLRFLHLRRAERRRQPMSRPRRSALM